MCSVTSLLVLFFFLLHLFLIDGLTADNSKSGRKLRTRGIKWWNLAKVPHYMTENLVDPETTTYINPSMQPLTRKQRRLVARNPGTIGAITTSASLAVDECQYQFRTRRWNCSVSDENHGGSLFGKILRKGCRESAFIYAITSAALAHSVARACADGSIFTCTCADQAIRYAPHPAGRDWQWGGCGDNIAFGYKFSKDFIDVVEKGHDLRHMMNLHNNEAGRRHVRDALSQACKCHGMSGSCTLRTCWMQLPEFGAVGSSIKARFDGATRVQQGNAGLNRQRKRLNLIPVDPKHKPPSRKDLVYFERSPSFCDADTSIGHDGTPGRVCNVTSLGTDGCELMCCGRGYGTEIYTARERCNCVFHWCCHVTCDTCHRRKVRYVCL